VELGPASGLGEAYWKDAKLRFESRVVTLYDMVLSVR
jgi:hypothetical protein